MQPNESHSTTHNEKPSVELSMLLQCIPSACLQLPVDQFMNLPDHTADVTTSCLCDTSLWFPPAHGRRDITKCIIIKRILPHY